MTSPELGKRKVEVNLAHPSPASHLSNDPRMKLDLAILISHLMEGDDVEGLRREYGSELIEEALSVLENRI